MMATTKGLREDCWQSRHHYEGRALQGLGKQSKVLISMSQYQCKTKINNSSMPLVISILEATIKPKLVNPIISTR